MRTIERDSENTDDTALQVTDLAIDLRIRRAAVPVVSNVSFSLRRGTTLGIVGESGCGKTLSSLAIMGVLPRAASIRSGTAMINGKDLLTLKRSELDLVRGKDISMIFQDAKRSLNPSLSIKRQITEAAMRHQGISQTAATFQALEMLEAVGIPHARQRLNAFPHELSGGMAQRVMIAVALINKPDVVIADEPTTALDVTIQAQILRLLKRLQKEMGVSMILITHDLGVISEVADEVAVMYAGEIVEHGPVHDIFARPRHPYMSGLLSSVGAVRNRLDHLTFIPGVVPGASRWPSGCRFHPRCAYSIAACVEQTPNVVDVGLGHISRCLRTDDLDLTRGDNG